MSTDDRSMRPAPPTPLGALVDAARRIADGDRERRLPVPDEPDLADLAEAVNDITDCLVRNENLLGENIRSLQTVNRRMRDMQENLLATEKLATIGRIAAGVAHEIGNPIGAILGYLDLLKRRNEIDQQTRDWLTRMEGEAWRINAIIRELVDFARPTSSLRDDLDVNRVVDSAVELLAPQRGFGKIAFEKNLAAGLPFVRGDEHRLRQVVVNLMVNAADAMGGEGAVRVSTRLLASESDVEPSPALPPRRRSDPQQVDYSHLRPSLVFDPTADRPRAARSAWVEIRVADSGKGIPPEELRQIFDPFFTTKAPGQGTGLGLAIALSIVQAMHGRIHVASQPGAGSTFAIELPTPDAAVASAAD